MTERKPYPCQTGEMTRGVCGRQIDRQVLLQLHFCREGLEEIRMQITEENYDLNSSTMTTPVRCSSWRGTTLDARPLAPGLSTSSTAIANFVLSLESEYTSGERKPFNERDISAYTKAVIGQRQCPLKLFIPSPPSPAAVSLSLSLSLSSFCLGWARG